MGRVRRLFLVPGPAVKSEGTPLDAALFLFPRWGNLKPFFEAERWPG
jgi:hypothetical protein